MPVNFQAIFGTAEALPELTQKSPATPYHAPQQGVEDNLQPREEPQNIFCNKMAS